MLGVSGSEFLVIILVAVIVIGPQRLPEYTRKLTQAVRRLRVFLDDAKEQIAEEVGPELADLNLSDLDPRNYDPRKIVRDALGEDLDAIRKDLANPIQSVAKDARDADSDAVKTEAASRSKKSLSRMIDDRLRMLKMLRMPSLTSSRLSWMSPLRPRLRSPRAWSMRSMRSRRPGRRSGRSAGCGRCPRERSCARPTPPPVHAQRLPRRPRS